MTNPHPPQDGRFRILIIEDDPTITRLTLKCLSDAGFDCRCEADGISGLQAFREFEPHLVLLDLMMPGMDGEQVCAQIRETSTVPVIVITARGAEETRFRIFKMGADDYITKPFGLKALLSQIVEQLRRVYNYEAVEQ